MREVDAGGAAGGAGSTSNTSLLDNRESGRLLKLKNSQCNFFLPILLLHQTF